MPDDFHEQGLCRLSRYVFEAMSQPRATTTRSISARVFRTIPDRRTSAARRPTLSIDGYNQYPSMMGIPELRQAISAHYGRWHGLVLDP